MRPDPTPLLAPLTNIARATGAFFRRKAAALRMAERGHSAAGLLSGKEYETGLSLTGHFAAREAVNDRLVDKHGRPIGTSFFFLPHERTTMNNISNVEFDASSILKFYPTRCKREAAQWTIGAPGAPGATRVVVAALHHLGNLYPWQHRYHMALNYNGAAPRMLVDASTAGKLIAGTESFREALEANPGCPIVLMSCYSALHGPEALQPLMGSLNGAGIYRDVWAPKLAGVVNVTHDETRVLTLGVASNSSHGQRRILDEEPFVVIRSPRQQ